MTELAWSSLPKFFYKYIFPITHIMIDIAKSSSPKIFY